MDKFGLKATLYDVVGYVIPGLFLLCGLYAVFTLPTELKINSLLSLSVSLSAAAILLASSYAVGHIVASLGSLMLENKRVLLFLNQLYPFDEALYERRAQEIFGVPYSKCSDRIISAFCQEKHPIVYGDAFVFLSIYGFSRNASVSLGIVMISYWWKLGLINWGSILFLVVIALLLHNYFRFKSYYKKQVASSLLM